MDRVLSVVWVSNLRLSREMAALNELSLDDDRSHAIRNALNDGCVAVMEIGSTQIEDEQTFCEHCSAISQVLVFPQLAPQNIPCCWLMNQLPGA